nr:AMP-binding protein [Bacteroidota bacterium]
ALVCLNTKYIAGIMMLVRCLEGGMKTTISEPTSNPVLGLAQNLQISFSAMVPLQVQNCLENKESRKKFEKINTVIIGGAPISLKLQKELKNFKNNIFQTYGMTETLSHIALRKLTGEEKHEFYNVLAGIKIKTDNRGCLMVRGGVTNHEWVVTNDLVTIVDSDKFKWLGRADNVLNSGGIKIQVEDLEFKMEKIFQELNLNRRFFVSSLPDDFLGQKVVLIIEGNESETITHDILSLIPNHFQKFEAPKNFFYCSLFKEITTGKIQRTETLRSIINKNEIK